MNLALPLHRMIEWLDLERTLKIYSSDPLPSTRGPGSQTTWSCTPPEMGHPVLGLVELH